MKKFRVCLRILFSNFSKWFRFVVNLFEFGIVIYNFVGIVGIAALT